MGRLKDHAEFRVFIRLLWASRESAVERCLLATTRTEAETLRMEARVYNDLLKELRRAGVKDEQASGSS